MNKLLNILLVLLIILAFVFGYVISNNRHRLPDDSIVVKRSFLDSLQIVASMPPDTVTKDSIIKGDIVYVPRPYPVPVYIDKDSVKHYADSIRREDIDARVDLKVKGDLLSIDWRYRPITREHWTIISKPVPYPVRYDVNVPVPQRGMFLMLGIGKGFGIDKPAFSAEIFYQTRKASLIGGEVGYFQQPYFEMKFGKKF